MVVLGDSRTEWVGVKFGVPQGSVLGPILYILFTADISLLFSKHRANGHLYAGDTQAFVHGPSSDQLSLVVLLIVLLLIFTTGCRLTDSA